VIFREDRVKYIGIFLLAVYLLEFCLIYVQA